MHRVHLELQMQSKRLHAACECDDLLRCVINLVARHKVETQASKTYIS